MDELTRAQKREVTKSYGKRTLTQEQDLEAYAGGKGERRNKYEAGWGVVLGVDR